MVPVTRTRAEWGEHVWQMVNCAAPNADAQDSAPLDVQCQSEGGSDRKNKQGNALLEATSTLDHDHKKTRRDDTRARVT